MTRSTTKKILIYVSLSFLASIAILVIFVTTFDWNRLKPTINDRVSEATGRVFEIRGDLDVSWRRVDHEGGWQSWIPWPRPSASYIVLSNPDWAETGDQMVSLQHAAVSINPFPLLAKKVVLHDLDVEVLNLNLERDLKGKNNWSFKETEDEPSKWTFDIGRLAIKQAELRYLDPTIRLDLRAQAQTLDENDEKGYGLKFTAGGTYNKAPIKGGGKTGGVLSLREKDAVFPVQAKVDIGKNMVAVEGTVTQPTAVTAIDLDLTLSGPSMANLYQLTGILLPDTPPYTTKGFLSGRITPDRNSWEYRKFTGTVGESDLAGTLEFIQQKPRPLLRGSLVSNQLRLEDLGAVVKADSNAEKVNRDAKAVQPTAKALPTEEFTTDKWGTMDADVKFTGRKIIRSAELPIEDLKTEIHLKEKVLKLTPLDFGVAGGNLTSNITLDGRTNTIQAQVKSSARHLKINQLFPTLESMDASLGEVNADASLSGTGNSVATMLASANGEIKAAVTEGTVSKFILEAAGLNVPNAVFAKLFGDKQVQMNCLATDFDIKSGLMQTEYFVMDTDDAVVTIDGTINLSSEAMNLDIRPKTKGLRIISLRSPLYVKGTFKQPDIGLQKGALAAKAAGAVVLGTVAPIAAVVPLINPGRTDAINCNKYLADYKEKPKAPPPSK